MKATVNGLVIISFLMSMVNCGKDNEEPSPGGSENLGTFAGYLQVRDDPQTDLGYVFNVTVTVIRSGSTATVKIKGDDGFDREYTGRVTVQSATAFDMFIDRQTKPADKLAGDRLVIFNNELTVEVSLASDNVVVRDSPASATTAIGGKIKMIGTNLLRQ